MKDVAIGMHETVPATPPLSAPGRLENALRLELGSNETISTFWGRVFVLPSTSVSVLARSSSSSECSDMNAQEEAAAKAAVAAVEAEAAEADAHVEVCLV